MAVLGEAYLASGDSARAANMAETLLERHPQHPRGLFLRARSHLMRGEAEQALNDLQAYIRARPSDPWGYRELGRCLGALGRDEAAQAQERIADLVLRRLHRRVASSS